MSEYNRTHMAGKNLRKKSNPEVGNLRFVGFQVFAYPKYSVKFGPIALPNASTRCQQSLFRLLL